MRFLPFLLIIGAASSAWAAGRGQLEVKVTDRDTGQPIAVRMHLKDAKGKPVRPPKVPYWHDHFVFEGKIILDLPLGHYTFEMERGPEYRVRSGYFTLERGAADNKEVDMPRFVDMKQAGWWSGDLHIHRPLAEIETLMRAEDLHVAPVITWWNDKNIWDKQPLPAEPLVKFADTFLYHRLAGEDEREGGALLFFNLQRPLPIAGAARELPSGAEFLALAREAAADKAGAHVDAEKPFWWDFPMWVATGQVHSVGVAHNHLHRDGVLASEAWGKPRDKLLYPDPHGNGRWTQHIYFHLLNTGHRLPPSAGSASGVLPNPVGYNRVYVHCGESLTWEKWWAGLRAGRVVVTNGPLLQPLVNGELPGHVFQADAGQTVELEPALSLSTRDKIDYLEVIQDGKVAHEVRLDEYAKAQGRLPKVKFDKSGWMCIRAVASHPKTYRFALTGPYYVEIGYQPRISRSSAQFFLDWVVERARRIQLDDPEQREQVIRHHRAARDYWQKLVDKANVD